MPIVEQISVFLENQPGRLGRLCSVLAESGINIEAIMVPSGTDYGIVHLVVDDHPGALRALEGRGYRTYTSRVLDVGVADEPGALGAIADRLADGGVDIKYGYSAVSGDRGRVILSVGDAEAGRRLLEEGAVSGWSSGG